MRNPLSIKQMQSFVTVAEHGSFVAAARELHLTPAAVSNIIKTAEDALGFLLFERTTRFVRLTPCGQALHESAACAMTAIQQVGNTLGKISRSADTQLRVAAGQILSGSVMPQLIRQFKSTHSGCCITLREGLHDTLEGMLASDEADVVFWAGKPPAGTVRRVKLADIPLHVLCRPEDALSQLPCVRWENLASRLLITSVKNIGEAVHRLAGADLSQEYVTFVSTALGLVACGTGVAVMPLHVRPMADHLRLRMIPLADPRASIELSAITSSADLEKRALSEFLSFLEGEGRAFF